MCATHKISLNNHLINLARAAVTEELEKKPRYRNELRLREAFATLLKRKPQPAPGAFGRQRRKTFVRGIDGLARVHRYEKAPVPRKTPALTPGETVLDRRGREYIVGKGGNLIAVVRVDGELYPMRKLRVRSKKERRRLRREAKATAAATR